MAVLEASLQERTKELIRGGSCKGEKSLSLTSEQERGVALRLRLHLHSHRSTMRREFKYKWFTWELTPGSQVMRQGKKSQSRVHQPPSHSMGGIVLRCRMGFRATPELEEMGFSCNNSVRHGLKTAGEQGSTHTQKESPWTGSTGLSYWDGSIVVLLGCFQGSTQVHFRGWLYFPAVGVAGNWHSLRLLQSFAPGQTEAFLPGKLPSCSCPVMVSRHDWYLCCNLCPECPFGI